MHAKPARRGGWRWSAVALLVLLALAAGAASTHVAGAHAAKRAVVGDCVAGADGGRRTPRSPTRCSRSSTSTARRWAWTLLVVSPTLVEGRATWKSLHMALLPLHDARGSGRRRWRGRRATGCRRAAIRSAASAGARTSPMATRRSDAVMTGWLNPSGHRANIGNRELLRARSASASRAGSNGSDVLDTGLRGRSPTAARPLRPRRPRHRPVVKRPTIRPSRRRRAADSPGRPFAWTTVERADERHVRPRRSPPSRRAPRRSRSRG